MNLSHRVAMYRITHITSQDTRVSACRGLKAKSDCKCCSAEGEQGELLRRGVVYWRSALDRWRV